MSQSDKRAKSDFYEEQLRSKSIAFASTVFIRLFSTTGFFPVSGFSIAPNMVVTCKHKVEETDFSNIIITKFGQNARAKDVYLDSHSDIAVILLDRPLKGDIAPLAKTNMMKGDKIETAAFLVEPDPENPKNISLKPTQDTARFVQSATFKTEESQDTYWFYEDFEHAKEGFSGAAIFNDNDQVVSSVIGVAETEAGNHYMIGSTNEQLIATIQQAQKTFNRKYSLNQVVNLG